MKMQCVTIQMKSVEQYFPVSGTVYYAGSNIEVVVLDPGMSAFT